MCMVLILCIYTFFYLCSVSLMLCLFSCVLFTVPSAQGVKSDNDPNNTTVRSFFYFLMKQIIFILVLIICLAVEHRFLLVALTRMSLKIRWNKFSALMGKWFMLRSLLAKDVALFNMLSDLLQRSCWYFCKVPWLGGRMWGFHGVAVLQTNKFSNKIRTSGLGLLLAIMVTGKATRPMDTLNLRTLICMVMELMLAIKITNSNQYHSSHSSNREVRWLV